MLYSVRSERMLMEQLAYNLLFRWFVGLSANEPVWHPTVFTKNRDRLLEGAVAEEFFSLIVREARSRKLLSDDHFTVDGTLIEAWAGQKSFQRKDDDHDPLNPPPVDQAMSTVNWRKGSAQIRRMNHEQTRWRGYMEDARSEARLAYLGHVLTENRNGLVVDVRTTQASGTAEREAALAMLSGKLALKRVTLGGDKGYDTRGFVEATRELNVTPHVAQNNNHRRSAIDERTTRHDGYAVSQRKRKRVEEVFGWMKTVALQRKTRFRGLARVGWMFTFAAYTATWCGCEIFRRQTRKKKCGKSGKKTGHLGRVSPTGRRYLSLGEARQQHQQVNKTAHPAYFSSLHQIFRKEQMSALSRRVAKLETLEKVANGWRTDRPAYAGRAYRNTPRQRARIVFPSPRRRLFPGGRTDCPKRQLHRARRRAVDRHGLNALERT